jgi:hypothetical protein
MRLRIGVALALALAGCSGSGSTPVDAAADGDARGTDSRADADGRPDADASPAEASAADVPADRGDATEGGLDTDARPDADAAEAGPEAGPNAPDGLDGGDVAETDAAKGCTTQVQTLTLPTGPVTGTLSGAGTNSVVSCQLLTQTLGSDASFRLKVDTFSLVEIVVQSPLQTFVAVRPGCGEDGTELACSGQTLDQSGVSTGFAGAGGSTTGFAGSGGFFTGAAGSGGFFDGGAGVPPPTGAAGTSGAAGAGVLDAGTDAMAATGTGLRVRLAPGVYTIVVDTFAGAGSGPFTLTARAVPPADNSSCAAPEVLEASVVKRGRLDLAGAPRVGCSGSSSAPLYYAVGVPAGQRLTARVQPLLAGDRAWQPRIEALNTCTQGMACLAQGHVTAGSAQQLDWINNSTSWRLVTLAVSSDGPVNGAQFELSASVTDLLATCSRPTPLKDGMALFSQDISLAGAPGMATCGSFNDHALYYAATVLPGQTLQVQAVGSSTQSPFSSPVIANLRSSCDVGSCLPNTTGISGSPSFTNSTDEPTTIILEIAPSGSTFDPRYDLHVSLPLPPAGVTVTPTSGLVTSESGQTATFKVALKSPPTKSVTFPIASDTPAEGTASPAALVFDPTSWDTPQTVTVTGVDDHQNDGPRKYTIAVGIGSSGDSRYAGFDPADVSVTNLDDEPGLLITGGDDNVVTSEGGLQATFTVRLNSKPSDTVRLPLSSSDAGEGTVSPAELEFGPTDWNTPQTVTVTGVDDAMADGVQAYTVVLGALVSNDAAYAGLDPPDLAAHNRDDDFQAVVLKLLSTDSCGFPNRGGMAADGFGTLYVLLFCNSQLAVISSSDGGATFTAPVNIPDSADLGGDIAITAGAGGAVYVGFEVPGFGLMLTASHDSGVTWSQRALLTASGGNVRLAAGGQTVIATTTNPNGSTSIMMRSNDGGRSFAAPRQFDAQAIDVAVSPDGQTVWVPELSNANKLHGSSDGGATFADFGTLDLTFGPYAFGPRHLFQGGTFMQVVTLSDTTMVRTITNPSNPGQVFSVAVDSAETATMLQQANDGNHTEAVRFTESGTPASPKQLGPRADGAGAVALSTKAVASILYTGGLPLFTVTVFP